MNVGDNTNSTIPISLSSFSQTIKKLEYNRWKLKTIVIMNQLNARELTKSIRQALDIWQNAYLLNLRERTQSKMKSKRTQAEQEPNNGNIVIIKDDITRGNWKFGKIIQIKAKMVRYEQQKCLLQMAKKSEDH
jgi:hypothetical protein